MTTQTTITPRELAIATAEAFSTGARLITDHSRKKDPCQARHMFCYMLHEEYGWTITKIALILGRDRSTIRHAIERGRAQAQTPHGQRAHADILRYLDRAQAQTRP